LFCLFLLFVSLRILSGVSCHGAGGWKRGCQVAPREETMMEDDDELHDDGGETAPAAGK
jgi:hypothetical protein